MLNQGHSSRALNKSLNKSHTLELGKQWSMIPKSNLQDFVASFVERSSGEIVESSQVLEVGVLVCSIVIIP